MSFFDEDDRPTQQQRSSRASRLASTDRQTLMARRAVAAGAGLLVLVLLIFGIKGCLDSRKKSALKNYNRNVAALVEESDQTGASFFSLLSGGKAKTAIELENDVNQLRVSANDLVKRSQKLDTPDAMQGAERSLVLALELRRDGLAKIAAKLPTALGNQGASAAVTSISAQMQAFLASDVLYAQRVVPLIDDALKDSGVGGQTIATSRFLPSLSWLSPETVATRLENSLRGGSSGSVTPGLHGFQLLSTTAGDTALTPDTPNRIVAGSDLAFTVKFQNQGENDEFDVPIKLTVKGGSGKPITVTKTVDEVAQGAEGEAVVPLGQAPPIGTPVTITAAVGPVPGEKKTDNNSESYTAIFSR